MPALEKLSIDTPEQVALEFSLATIGSRFLAVATDTLIQIGGAATLLFAASTMAWAARFTIDGTTPWLLAGVILGLFIL